MLISPIKNSINFSAISLNQKERKKAEQAIAVLQSNPEESAKNNLLQIFDKHIIKEVESKYSFSPQKDDYLQAYYTALFDAIDQKMTLDGIIEFVNKPDFKSNIVHSKYSNECLISGHKLKLLTEDDLPQYASAPDEEKVLHYKDKLDRVSKNLTSSQYEALQYMAFHEKYNQCKHLQAKIAVAKIQKENDVLPEKYYVIAKKFQDVIWCDKDLETIVDLLIQNQKLLSVPFDRIKYNFEKSAKLLNNRKVFFVYPRLMCIKPEVIDKRVNDGAEKFGVTREKYISTIERNPVMLENSVDYLYNNVENGAKVLNLPLKTYIKCAFDAARLFTTSAENILENVEEASKILGISSEQFIKSGVRCANVFALTPDLVEKKAKAFSEILETNNIGKIFVLNPNLFTRDIQTIKSNKERISEIMELSDKETVKLLKKSTKMLCYNFETLETKIDLLAKELNRPKTDIVNACKKAPDFITNSVDYIKSNIDTVTKELSLSKDDYINAGLSYPLLLMYKPETVIKNTSELADWFGKTKEEMAKIILKTPCLAILKPQTIINNVENLVKLFNDNDFKQKALADPLLMQLKPETIYHKYSLQKYCKSLKGLPVESVSIPRKSDEYLLCEMLRILINKANQVCLAKQNDFKNNLIKFINSNPDYDYNFKIPDDGYIADELIKFTHDLCEENFGKQIIKIEKYADKSN